MPLCALFPVNLSVLVMDNARIHHGAKILELAECFGLCFITIFLMMVDNCFIGIRIEFLEDQTLFISSLTISHTQKQQNDI